MLITGGRSVSSSNSLIITCVLDDRHLRPERVKNTEKTSQIHNCRLVFSRFFDIRENLRRIRTEAVVQSVL